MDRPRVWTGARAPHGTYPPPGTWATYALVGDDDTVVYVGMTRALADRLRHHRAQRPGWSAWVAQEAADETDAATQEAAWLAQFTPAQNEAGQ